MNTTTTTTTSPTRWYVVPEVWLMLVMLGATVAGSLALVGTAFEHRDDLLHADPSIAAPLPPSTAAQRTPQPASAASPADAATP